MPDGFVPFSTYVHPEPTRAPDLQADTEQDRRVPEEAPADLRVALREARRFRAALADAFDAAREDVLRDLAADVLARELLLAPSDLERVARRAFERLCDEERPLRARVHPDDAPAARALDVPIVADATLRRGDLVLELRYGTTDLTLGARLSAALDASRS
jgi:hypothetical protein